MNDYELYHYGVLGMKWGVRRARRKEAKQQYKKRTAKAFDEYERTIGGIEKPYKRGQNLSDKDMKREAAAEKKYQDTVAKAKADYKRAKTSKHNDAAIANKLYPKQSKGANARVVNTSTGKALAQSLLMGSYGTLKYNEAKARGQTKGKACVEAILYNGADAVVGGLLGTVKYADNVKARK